MHGLFLSKTKIVIKSLMLFISDFKQNKIWVHKGIEFFNRTMKSSLQDNDTEIHSSHNEGKFV